MPTSDSGLNQIKLMVNSHCGIKPQTDSPLDCDDSPGRHPTCVQVRRRVQKRGGVGMKQVLCLMITPPFKVVTERRESENESRLSCPREPFLLSSSLLRNKLQSLGENHKLESCNEHSGSSTAAVSLEVSSQIWNHHCKF